MRRNAGQVTVELAFELDVGTGEVERASPNPGHPEPSRGLERWVEDSSAGWRTRALGGGRRR
ncbi:MAG TPA: hypothetical protein VGO14_09015 [Solirubrobacteraceae bacterium]|nr:hypothetical protein [Solirubrobacteraceae bacterium]